MKMYSKMVENVIKYRNLIKQNVMDYNHVNNILIMYIYTLKKM